MGRRKDIFVDVLDKFECWEMCEISSG